MMTISTRPISRCLRRYASSYNTNYDVILVGGGVIGLSSAYFLAKRINPSSICVIERDTNYVRNSSVLSWGSIRQQFSTGENIQMSQFGFNFLSNINDYLGIDGEEPVDIQLQHGTYCFLASQSGKDILQENAEVQSAYNTAVSLLSKDDLAAKYPWLNADGVVMASNVSYGEGWFDPWSLLSSLKNKVSSMGVHFLKAEVKDIDHDNQHILGVQISTSNNSTSTERLACSNLVNAAGAWAKPIALMAGCTDLPVEPALRVTYVVHCPQGFTDPVLLIDGARGLHLRPEGSGKQYIVADNPEEENIESREEDFLNIDYDYFDNVIWPKLAHRIPAFENLKVINAWAGYYDYNTMDQNGIISAHPQIGNLFFANGFSGHGIQQAPAVGRAISELILDRRFSTIDLSRFSYERFHQKRFIIERNII